MYMEPVKELLRTKTVLFRGSGQQCAFFSTAEMKLNVLSDYAYYKAAENKA